MITNINGGAHVVVVNGSSSGPYINNHNNQPMVGMVRYHTNSFQVYDGNMWLGIATPSVTIDLSSSANSAINWAMTKMAEEAELQKMAYENPAVKAAYENLKKAAEQLKTTIILSKDQV